MTLYADVKTYFQVQYLDTSFERGFKFFYVPEAIMLSNKTLNAEFTGHRMFALMKEDDVVVPGLDVLRKKRDHTNLPVLAYALAGEVSTEHFDWLLQILGKELIQSYDNLHWPLITIAATHGSQERLNLLLQYYQPTENEWLQGLFFAAYHGHTTLFSFILDKINTSRQANHLPELDIHSLKDSDGNTFLQIAVLGQQEEAIDFFARGTTYDYLEFRNNKSYRAIDETVLSYNKQLVIQLVYFYTLQQTTVNYDELILVLIRNGQFLDHQKDMLSHLREKQTNDLASLEKWITSAIDTHNNAIVKEFLTDLPWVLPSDYLSNLINHAATTNNRDIEFLLVEEIAARRWIKEVMENIDARLSSYITRQTHHLDQLARDDGLPDGSYREPYNTSDIPKRREDCQLALHNLFYGSYFKEIKQFYKKLPTNKRDSALFVDKIILKRQVLSRKIRGKQQDIKGFQQQIKDIIEIAASFFIEDSSVMTNISAPESMSVTLSHRTNSFSKDDDSDDEMPKFSEKQILFIDQFVNLFDQTYHLYKSLSSGDAIKAPDATDRMAGIAKEVAIGVLPNVNVSAPILGVPLPISLSLPTGVAVAAAIDLLLYMRQQRQESQAQRIGQFFDGWSPRARTNSIYECAEFLATRFRDQIKPLSGTESIPRLADIAVARIFNYAMGSRAHTQTTTSLSRSMNAMIYGGLSFIKTMPEPVYRRKSLIDIAIDALSTYHYNVFSWDTEDQRYLALDERLLSQGYSRDWTVKGILENTGIRINGHSYKGSGQNIKQYGYAYAVSPASKAEADKELARRGGMSECHDVPDFEFQPSPMQSMKMY
ncbi:MAG: hypothetical protein CK423_07170 [Legionella sp.]|nr:MAG: hypothetical protein CK423_07170 [Legionella sp.]